jgi:peroxiredoxin
MKAGRAQAGLRNSTNKEIDMTPLARSALMLFLLMLTPLANAALATQPNDVRVLPAGIAAPDAALRDIDGKATTLTKLLGGKPTLLVFYRGGWCPFCNLQLSELRKLKPLLTENGFQLLAVSPDAPEELQKSIDKHALDYTLASDSSSALMQAFGIGFKLDAATLEKYKEYGIDLEVASGGEKHHALPVPSVFVIDAKGIIQFAYSNPDYRTRVPERLVCAAVEAVALGEAGKPMK